MATIMKFFATPYYTLTTFLANNEDERINKADGLFFLWLICSGVFRMRIKSTTVNLISCIVDAIFSAIVIRVAFALFCPRPVRLGAPFCLILLDVILILSITL